MSTTAISGGERLERREARTRARVHLGRFGLEAAGVTAILVSAWGGIVPYIGSLFQFSADGSGAWHWDLAHAVLALAPGAAGVLLGLFIVAQARGIAAERGRLSLAAAGVLLMVCGAWFAVGPLAWPLISNSSHYFAAASPSALLARELGYSIGTGLVLMFCGAFVDGWASRHQRNATVIAEDVAADGDDAVAPSAYESTV